jgi:hypothetical protein
MASIPSTLITSMWFCSLKVATTLTPNNGHGAKQWWNRKAKQVNQEKILLPCNYVNLSPRWTALGLKHCAGRSQLPELTTWLTLKVTKDILHLE